MTAGFPRLAKGVFAALLALAPFTMSSPASAAQVMVVIDGSGSAAGRIGDIRKLDIARAALTEILRGAPLDLSLGVVGYGHRDREACTDFEVLAAPGPAADAIDAATVIEPLGRSPIAEATAAAAAALGTGDVEGTVVVITDNADNCAPDPCAIIADLHERMPNITVSIVGLAVPDEEVAALACFTELTGGVMVGADDADAFRTNLERVLVEAWSEPEIPLPTATLTIAGAVIQGQPFAVAYDGPRAPGDQIRISWFGTPADDHIVGANVHADGQPVTMTAPMERGAYELRYWHAERRAVIATARLQVEAIGATIAGPDAVQQGETFEATWTADARGGETIQFTEPFAPVDQPLIEVAVRRTNPTVSITAPGNAGRYEIRLVAPATAGLAAADRILARQTIDIIPATVGFTGPSSVVAGERFTIGWTGPGGMEDDIFFAPAGAPENVQLDAQRPRVPELTFRAPFPAGRYELRYWSGTLGRVIGAATIEVTLPRATVSAPNSAQGGGQIAVDWTGPGAIGDTIEIAAPGDGTPALFSTSASAFGTAVPLDVPAAAGTYEIRYVASRGAAVLARKTLTVSAPVVALTVAGPVEAGTAFATEWQGPAGRYDEIRLFRPLDPVPIGAIRVAAGTTAMLTAPSEPGTYVLAYWSGTAGIALGTVALDVVCTACPPAATPTPAPTPTPTGNIPLRP